MVDMVVHGVTAVRSHHMPVTQPRTQTTVRTTLRWAMAATVRHRRPQPTLPPIRTLSSTRPPPLLLRRAVVSYYDVICGFGFNFISVT